MKGRKGRKETGISPRERKGKEKGGRNGEKRKKKGEKEMKEKIEKKVIRRKDNKSSKDCTWSAEPDALLGVISCRSGLRAGQLGYLVER